MRSRYLKFLNIESGPSKDNAGGDTSNDDDDDEEEEEAENEGSGSRS